MLEVVIAYIITKLEALNLFTEVGGLAQLISREMEDQEGEAVSVIFPAFYDGNGNHIYIDQNSAWETGISYFRQTGDATEEDGEGEAPTPDDVQLKKTWPMRIVCLLPKDVISVSQDDNYITDKLITNVESALNIDNDKALRQSLGVDYASIRVTAVNPNKDEVFNEEFTEVANKVGHEFALFYVDFDIVVEGSKDCINNFTCAGEDLPSFVATVNDANNPDSPIEVKVGDSYTCELDESRILDFEFGATGDDAISRIIGGNQAATYTINALTNIATVVYKVNAVVKVLPFSVVNTDTLEVTITRTAAGVLSRVVLTGS